MRKNERLPMILTIDTTSKDELKIGLDDTARTIKTEKQSEKILAEIDTLLKKEKASLKDITVILVNNLAGSYTGTRIGVTIANTLAWTLDIPVISFQGKDFKETLKNLKLSTGKFEKIVMVQYKPDERDK